MEMMPSKKKIELIDPEVIKKRREAEKSKKTTNWDNNNQNWSNNWRGGGFRSDLPDHML